MFGISIFPEKSSLQENLDYIKLASSCGFKRIYTTLLSLNKTQEEIKYEFYEIATYAKKMGMHIEFDVSPHVLKQLGLLESEGFGIIADLSFFNDINASGIRLDVGFDGLKESLMTYNKFGLTIEIQMSNNPAYLDNLMSCKPNIDKLWGSFNFYPQEYSGLEYDFFYERALHFKRYGIKTTAFINSNVGKIGPWTLMDGMCTLEMHRYLNTITQAKHLLLSGVIDDMIVANPFASEDEMKQLVSLDKNLIAFKIISNPKNSELENQIIFNEQHFYRGDINKYNIRSTQSRVKFKKDDFPVKDTPEWLVKGDVIIGNNTYGQYKGELHIVKEKQLNRGRKNIVAKVVKEEVFLLDYLQPWAKFKFE